MSTDRALYEKMYAAQLAEGHDLETAMRYNKAATPEDFLRAFGQSSDPRHQHRKWGGGNKMGSGGAAVNAARRARAEARRSAPDANVNNYTNKNLADHLGLTALSNFVGVGANPSYGVPSIGSFNDVSSFSNFTGGLPSLDAGSVVGDPSLSSFSSFSPDSFLGNMAAIGVGYPHTNVREYDGKFLPYMGGGRPGNVRPKGPAAFIPRMAGIFAV